jgi:hypothetical protein
MGTVAFVVMVREEEGVRPVLGPHVAELSRIPKSFCGKSSAHDHSGGGSVDVLGTPVVLRRAIGERQDPNSATIHSRYT